MPHDQPAPEISAETTTVYHTGPSFQRASILFATSLGSFIGVSLLLASL